MSNLMYNNSNKIRKTELCVISDEIMDISAPALFLQTVFHLLFQHLIAQPRRRQADHRETLQHISDYVISQCASTLI